MLLKAPIMFPSTPCCLISTKLGQDIPKPKYFDPKPNFFFFIKDAQIWNILDVEVPNLSHSKMPHPKKRDTTNPTWGIV